MKEIIISRGYIALVDDEDFERANQFKWQSNVKTGSKTVYVQRGDYSCGKPKTQFLHHFIMGITDAKKNGITVDHINHNALDNRKSNLRICTYKENWRNRSKNKNGTSKFKGVSWSKTKKKWRTGIGFNAKCYFIGYFNNEIEAAIAYDKKAKELFGKFASLNFNEYD